MSPKCIGCFVLNGTSTHNNCIEETFLSCGPQPELLYNLFLTVWSIKLKQIFVVLQPDGNNITPSLNEAIVRIRDVAKCNETYNGAITDNMICAGPDSGFMGPCHVRVFCY
jgi:hypothetical protein